MFFFISNDPLRRNVSYVISEKKIKKYIIFLRYFHTWMLYSRNNEKTEDITTFALLPRILTRKTNMKQQKKKILRKK